MTGIAILNLVLRYGPGIINLIEQLQTLGDRELTPADWELLKQNHRTYDEIMRSGE